MSLESLLKPWISCYEAGLVLLQIEIHSAQVECTVAKERWFNIKPAQIKGEVQNKVHDNREL